MNNGANIQTSYQKPKAVLKDSPIPRPSGSPGSPNPPFNLLSGSPLGNITSYSAKPETEKVTEDLKIKHAFKKAKIERKKKIGKKCTRVGCCGTRPIRKDAQFVQAVQGEKGGIYYSGMQRCGSVWLCPDCMYKLMKGRAEELYKQLTKYRVKNKTVLFVTFTIQHHQGERLADLHGMLLDAFNFANSHRKWVAAKKGKAIEFLRALEVLYGLCGWHPHLHCVFVGEEWLIDIIKIFDDLYKQKLRALGKVVNEHTVVIKKWNGELDEMAEYMCKGMLEEEITGGNIKKSGKGKTFFELIDDNNDIAADEYVSVIPGKRQYHHSKGFFADVRVKADTEILKDDKAESVLFAIPKDIYCDINAKGIALHLLNEFEYGGKERAIKLLELYDCETAFLSG